jgi:hypothetical protein
VDPVDPDPDPEHWYLVYISVEYECQMVFLGLKNPLASLLSGKLSAVPRDRVEEIVTALQADIADTGSLSPLAALLLGELRNPMDEV